MTVPTFLASCLSSVMVSLSEQRSEKLPALVPQAPEDVRADEMTARSPVVPLGSVLQHPPAEGISAMPSASPAPVRSERQVVARGEAQPDGEGQVRQPQPGADVEDLLQALAGHAELRRVAGQVGQKLTYVDAARPMNRPPTG